MGNYRVCVCFSRKFKVTEAEPPTDVKEAFKKYGDGGNQMSAEQLLKFLIEVQGETQLTVADADAVVRQILQKRHPITKLARQALALDDFHHYLFSADLNPPINFKVLPPLFQFVCLIFTYTEFEKVNKV
ncbi:hypothetical protein KY289_026355 [Solanum tuberosum]|nr:hypothetical protein KY289_026355 [Solanum tuberosum]